ncbi:MAG: chromosome segregation SMC family protein [Candidatus Pacearchaeota archaeon]
MTYIKKIFIHGFKSFAKPTEIFFDKQMNVIVGPNGSGKSNIVDAICFVFGRLSAKSMRVSRSSNLIYNGGKTNKPANFARVSLVFDNSDRTFSIDSEEVEISRIVRRDGTSIYKINNETKTRQEVLELLAQAGIDPEGFNIILQAQIDTVVKMRPEERRQIIEEVAGISVYETRKEKSLHELEKTDEKLREVGTILRERAAFMNNLEKERKQALKHEFLKNQIKKCNASLLAKKIEEKDKEIQRINKEVEKKQKEIAKISASIDNLRKQIEQNSKQIQDIEKQLERETGTTQEKLVAEILAIKTALAAFEVKRENIKEQIENTIRKQESNVAEKARILQEIKEIEEKASVKVDKSEKEKFEFITSEIEKLKQELREIELKQKSFEIKKIEVEKKETILEEKEKQKNILQRQIEELEKEILSFEKSFKEEIDENEIKNKKAQHQILLEESKKRVEEIEQELTKLLTKKEIHKKDVEEIFRLEQCPKCKQKITKEYREKLAKDIWETIKIIEKEIENKKISKEKIEKEIEKLAKELEEFMEKEQRLISFYEKKKIFDLKRKQLDVEKEKQKALEKECDALRKEIFESKKELSFFENEKLVKRHAECTSKIEKLKEDLLKLKLNKPLQLYIERDFETELALKNRELEQCERNIKQAQHDKLELEAKLEELTKKIDQEIKKLKSKEQEREQIEKRFNKLVLEKQKLQEKNHHIELEINECQIHKNLIEQELNEMKIEKAKLEAESFTLKEDYKQFEGIELIKASREEIENKLKKYEQELSQLGPVNLKALEIYETVKKEYDEIKEKVEKLEKEKQEILKVIAEIDKKKKQAFMQVFNAINKYFSENFAMLSDKGIAFLELENKEDPFAGGVNIVIKLAKGKYMDAETLSGGEKVIVALALIFAIQKYKPYHFYIFDEIDAALDKRNSEKLSNLIGQDKKSQYIIVTHNDVMINNATSLYGTSMQDGITKVVSLKV